MWSQVCNQSQYQFAITMLIQNHVFRLNISVDDTPKVKKAQGLNDTSCVEPGAAFVQTSSETEHASAGFNHDSEQSCGMKTDERHKQL